MSMQTSGCRKDGGWDVLLQGIQRLSTVQVTGGDREKDLLHMPREVCASLCYGLHVQCESK